MVRRASYEFDGQLPQAGQYIRSAADQIDSVSSALRTRQLGELVVVPSRAAFELGHARTLFLELLEDLRKLRAPIGQQAGQSFA